MSTLLISHPDCLDHEAKHHPERPERLSAVMDHLTKSGLRSNLIEVEATMAERDQLTRTHPDDFVQFIEGKAPNSGQSQIDMDTYMSPGSLRAAKLAAGACIQATEQVIGGAAQNAFCAVRPPGHHAELRESMGFCLFNNIALAAETALAHDNITRVAILDFDVHHCNGTVDIFKDRPEVLVCSSFQYPFYPDRYLDFTNEHIVNTPLAAGTTGDDFRVAVEASWLPAVEKHQPDMVFISAGFDAHRDDPMGELNLVESDYHWVTRTIMQLAESHAQKRLVSTLEGGYDLGSLRTSVEAHVQELLG